VGATNVGAIHQTFSPEKQRKGAEKGYFSFGGSALLLFFEPNRIQVSEDILENTRKGYETRCILGQPLGKAIG
jgi:phosphatidylserine decarboxylase